MSDDKMMQIMARILSDIGEMKRDIAEIEHTQAKLEQRINKLEGKPYASAKQLEEIKQHQARAKSPDSGKESKDELLDLFKQLKKPNRHS